MNLHTMKVHRILFLLTTVFLLGSCQKEVEPGPAQPETLLEKSDLDKIILDQMGDDRLFDWRNVDARTIWSASLQSDSIVAIGYTVEGRKDLSETIHLVDTESPEWIESKDNLIDFVLEGERKARGNSSLTSRDIMPEYMNDEWPTVFIQVSSLETVKALLTADNVRYVEPVNYWISANQLRSSSGCSSSPDYGININDYTTVSPLAKVPWTFYEHNINQAWATSTGTGKKVCIIDTGASFSQDNLGSNFNSGNSSGRSVEKYSTKYSGSWWWASLDSPNDDCGHGTSMSGTATAPWSNDGNALGVAYNAGLVSVRGVEDVVINTGNEKRGVRDALKYAGNRSDVDIVSMSIGTPFYSSTVADGVNYAYNDEQDGGRHWCEGRERLSALR